MNTWSLNNNYDGDDDIISILKLSLERLSNDNDGTIKICLLKRVKKKKKP